ncbi:hypothetical protein LY78DRAFT_378218 [Colletotrichum sublineola]|nr:hypothetical protein LY78DRAFT_378218 [Colletotrichum sublineola]
MEDGFVTRNRPEDGVGWNDVKERDFSVRERELWKRNGNSKKLQREAIRGSGGVVVAVIIMCCVDNAAVFLCVLFASVVFAVTAYQAKISTVPVSSCNAESSSSSSSSSTTREKERERERERECERERQTKTKMTKMGTSMDWRE